MAYDSHCVKLDFVPHGFIGVVICLERGADLHMAQWIPLPLTVSCFSKIQIGFTFLVPAHPGSPGQRAIKRVCVCVVLLMVSSVVSEVITLWRYINMYTYFCTLYLLLYSTVCEIVDVCAVYLLRYVALKNL